MFSSPAFRVLNQQENRESVINRKPGVTGSARKPLGDRSVNIKAPEKQTNFPQKGLKSTKPKPLKPQSVNAPTPKSLDLLYDYPEWCSDTYSKKDIGDVEDEIFPKPVRLTDQDFINSVLRKTPLPNKKDLGIGSFIFEDDLFIENRNFIFPKEDVILKELPVEDVPIPDFDY